MGYHASRSGRDDPSGYISARCRRRLEPFSTLGPERLGPVVVAVRLIRPRPRLGLAMPCLWVGPPIGKPPKPRSTDRTWLVLNSPWPLRQSQFSVRPPLVLGCLMIPNARAGRGFGGRAPCGGAPDLRRSALPVVAAKTSAVRPATELRRKAPPFGGSRVSPRAGRRPSWRWRWSCEPHGSGAGPGRR